MYNIYILFLKSIELYKNNIFIVITKDGIILNS